MCVVSSNEQGEIKLFKTEVDYLERSSNGMNESILKLAKFVVTGSFLRCISEYKEDIWILIFIVTY